MTPCSASLRVHTYIGPVDGSAGNASPRFMMTSPGTPISARAWPTRPPPTIIDGATEAMTRTEDRREDVRRAVEVFATKSRALATEEAADMLGCAVLCQSPAIAENR